RFARSALRAGAAGPRQHDSGRRYNPPVPAGGSPRQRSGRSCIREYPRGRVYAEVNDSVNRDLAMANPNDQSATVSFYFTDSSGTNSGPRSLPIPANGQIASFLVQSPFSGDSALGGTLTFVSSLPVLVVALRFLRNERSDLLMSTLPVAELAAPL